MIIETISFISALLAAILTLAAFCGIPIEIIDKLGDRYTWPVAILWGLVIMALLLLAAQHPPGL